jgi:hypothetical protein
VDEDRMVTLADAVLAMQTMTRVPPTGQRESKCGDVNGNGRIDMGDLIYILQVTAGMRVPQP